MTPRVMYTIGYEGATREELLGALMLAGVEVVIDTRETPTSRRPEFRRNTLRDALGREGIAYCSVPGLGVPKRLRPYARTHRGVFASAYLRRLRASGEAMEETLGLARGRAAALLCFESDETQCHRSLLGTELASLAPLAITHLRVRRCDNADDEPRTPPVVRPEKKVQIARG